MRWLIIDRPERRNAIPHPGWSDLREAFEQFESSQQRVLVLTGAGGNFCSGADLADDQVVGSLSSTSDNLAAMQRASGAVDALYRLSKPTIAAVDGYAVGGGMNLAIGCDVTVATTGARFAEIFVKRGITIDLGGTWLLPRLVGLARAREIALTGREVAGPEAFEMGMVARLVEPDELEARVTELAEELAAGAPLAQRMVKKAINDSTDMTFAQALAFEDQAQSMLLASEDFATALEAFREGGDPDFSGR